MVNSSDPAVPERLDDVAAALAEGMPRTRQALDDLVRIPSISAAHHDPEPVRRSAEATAAILRDAGLAGVRLLEVEGAHPYVYGDWMDAGDGAPTVLLYAHHDVQPVATADRWRVPPFEPTEIDGRLFGRGSADDKAGVMVHVAAVRAWLDARGGLPVNVKVIVEGEEEIGSPHLASFLAEYADTLRADVIVLTDVLNWKVGWPGLTYSLRGVAMLDVRVRALEQPIHSGMWGGPVPDALTGLMRLVGTLHDERGVPAVDGFFDGVRPLTAEERSALAELGGDADELRRDAGMLPGVGWIGDPSRSILERMWMLPTITPIGVAAPSIEESAPTLVAEASARISVRLAPGQDPERIVAHVTDHLVRHAPWGMQVTVDPGVAVAAWITDPRGPAFDAARAAMGAAFGKAPALIGCGGTIPFVQPFSDAFGGAPCLLTGIEDPSTNAHGEDESLHLGDFEKACLSEAFLFAELASRLEATNHRSET